MGTSKSSSGSPSGVPLVPPWVPDAPGPAGISPTMGPGGIPTTGPAAAQGPMSGAPAPVVPSVPGAFNPRLNTSSPKAPEGRFRGARGQLGRFGKSGDGRYLKRGVSSYTKSGLGGRKQATRRFSGTANTAGALYGALNILSGGGAAQQPSLDRRVLEGKSAEEVIGAVIDATRPLDGTQDAEASRASINDALVELLEKQPDADLLNLNDANKEFVIERFVACDIFRRFILDVGNAIRAKAPTASAASSRLKEAKDYIKETVAASFKRNRESGKRIGQANVNSVVRELLEDSFRVFEEYIG